MGRRRRTPATRSPRSSTPAACLGAGPPAGLDRVLRRRHAHAAAGRRPGAHPRCRDARRSGSLPDAEVTTEANPDSVTPESLAALRAAGFTRVSFGMQSAVPHVLRVLERTHDPASVAAGGRLGARGRVRAGEPGPDLRDAGGVDRRLAGLGRGGPGLRAGPRLGVLPDRGGRHPACPTGAHRRDPGARRRRPGRQVRPGRRGLHGRRAGAGTRCPTGRATRLRAAGTTSSTGPARAGGAIGPGAHSHVAGERWWNVKHPSAYAARILAGESPAQDGEVLDEPRPALWSGCCWRSACATACRSTSSTSPLSTTSSPAASASSKATASCSPARVGCSRTRWCASWSGEGAGVPG